VSLAPHPPVVPQPPLNIVVKRYGPDFAADGGKVLLSARNGIFLFDRGFIEYHGDRFVDFSAIAYLGDEPVALLPAAIDRNTGEASSHPGLTFGGVVLRRELRGDAAIALINALLDSCKACGAKSLAVKLLPHIFYTYPSAELEYTLWRRGFTIIRRDLSSLLPLEDSLPLNSSKKGGITKAKKSGLVVGNPPLPAFYSLLTQVLQDRHGALPVHSLAELMLLMARFPRNISVRAATKNDQMLAGTIIFHYGPVWHTQYVASSPLGRKVGALDLVIGSVIDEARALGCKYLSFGVSTEAAGSLLNEGLLWQKESFGARSIVHDFMGGEL
jgi:Acetyltransferase (GNAT) domain